MENNAAEFEGAVARLQEIVTALENGRLELSKAIELYKEGKVLSEKCGGILKEAQLTVTGEGAADLGEDVKDD